MAIQVYRIDSLSEYLATVTSLKSKHNRLWFRGHENEDYKLMPTVYRDPYTWEREVPLLHQFKARAARFINPAPLTDIEWLFIMQHHKTPTRLLDWSESAIVALAFATQFRDEKCDKNANVWCLNPEELNSNIRFTEYKDEPIPNICECKDIQGIYESPRQEYPIAVIGPQNTERIIAQRGVFTLFPNKTSFEMESLSNASDFLVKIEIPKERINEIKTDLYYIGITESVLFPEIDSISKELCRQK